MTQDSSPYTVTLASCKAVALVLDSPHSGRVLPPDLVWSEKWGTLFECEDLLVDQLLSGADQIGVTLLAATYCRHHVDLNRSPDDISSSVVSGRFAPSRWAHPSGGVIRGLPGQTRRLTADELEARLQGAWWPYHLKLAELLAERRAQFGWVWHLDVHSMPSTVRTSNGEAVDIVLGDRHGTSASSRLTHRLAGCFLQEGFRVAVNDPYAGAEIIRRHGAPAEGRHSFQVEINRALFLDEDRFEASSGFDATRAALRRVLTQVAALTTAIPETM